MRSNMPPQKDFSRVPSVDIQRSVFNRSHSHKTTLDSGKLVPILCDEILPGDSVDITTNLFVRGSSPLDYPIMDNVHLDTFAFYAPCRTLWENWERFMGAQDTVGASIDYDIPKIALSSVTSMSLADYLGIPYNATENVNALPFRMYNKMWNEWFKAEEVQSNVTVDTDNGPDTAGDYVLLNRGKRHDYFTSCLPNPQRGSTASTLTLTGTVPVHGNGKALGLIDANPSDSSSQFGLYRSSGGNELQGAYSHFGQNVGYNTSASGYPDGGDALGVYEVSHANTGLVADMTSMSIDVEEFRLAIATQQFLELDSRAGTRYVELLKAHFGVTSPDFRLNRVEFLGSGTSMINVNPVTQTGETGTNAQGHQAGHLSGSHRMNFKKSFVEHGYLIILANIRCDLSYQHGIHKMWIRTDRFDFYFPTFANLGEQAVLNNEIFHQNTSADDDVWGYQERWSEYRYAQSRVSGKFHSDVTGTLEAWHLAQDFATLPVLNSTFMSDQPDMHRVMVDDDEPEFILDSFFEYRHARPMPVFSVPGLTRL